MDYEHAPGLLIIGGGAAAHAAVERAGARLLATVPLDAAAQAIAERSFDALLIQVDTDDPAWDALFAQVAILGGRAILSLAPLCSTSRGIWHPKRIC